ncbi:peptide deformylase [Anianabacter salinae]|uniref:peptide deformylase n=1 Tax=Anianabacter salinae TaxID=2851023 RepID=UPI00225E3BCB|nr:peptide deformylase [Anianabacter salinae]MBV0910782.1 peptide deformylase [Anianabacter salinae]
MSVLPIRLWGDPCLREVARPVDTITDEIRTLAQDMADTMYDAPGRGLAAPQVGVSLRMFVMDCQWKDTGEKNPLVVIDPVLSDPEDEMASNEEGCLSIPGVPVLVERPAAVTMRWRTLDGSVVARRLTGFEAICAQHEFDHLEGVMIPDRVDAQTRAAIEGPLAAIGPGA